MPNSKNSTTLLYILSKLGTTGKHKLFKILFFADMDHLKRFGRKVSSDTYIKMKYGPVPSALKNEVDSNDQLFEVDGKNVTGLLAPDENLLSKSDMDSLDKSISENKGLSFTKLTDKSHGSAWESAASNSPIDDLKIAEEAGASPEFIQYISEKNQIRSYLA